MCNHRFVKGQQEGYLMYVGNHVDNITSDLQVSPFIE